MDLCEGDLDRARSSIEEAWILTDDDSVHDRLSAKFAVAIELERLDCIAGRPRDIRVVSLLELLPERGECLEFDIETDFVNAFRLCVDQRWEEAESVLVKWHRFLKVQRSTSRWLESGVCLAAIKRLRSDMESAQRIVASLEPIATKTNDWNTLKRLNWIADQDTTISLLGTIIRTHPKPAEPKLAGDRLKKRKKDEASNAETQPPVAETQTPVKEEFTRNTPLFGWLSNLHERVKKAVEVGPGLSDFDALRSELIHSQNRDWSAPEDVGRALHLMIALMVPGVDSRGVWEWANRIVAPFQEIGYLISHLARLGMSLASLERFEQITHIDFATFSGELPPIAIGNDRLEQLVHKSLQLEPDSPFTSFRAGEVYEFIDRIGEAERCYARSFKLDRKGVEAALALADIYSRTDRNSDAHYVLDLCIREGGSSRELFFEAALRSQALGMHELQVSYLELLLERFTPQPWVYYYLAGGLLELKRPREALKYAVLERKEMGMKGIHLDAIIAEANVQLRRYSKARAAIQRALRRSLSNIENLTLAGINSAMERLYRAARRAKDHSLYLQVVDLLFQSGTVPESYFTRKRSRRKACQLSFYSVAINQPLDEIWSGHPGCLPEQSHWRTYVAQWGVLAKTESHATYLAMKYQSRCYHLTADLLDVVEEQEQLLDRPGIVFQGMRESGDDFGDFGDEDTDDDFGGGFGSGPPIDDDMPF
jgi:tetratricopeptide (TPR) repeat protein